MTSEQLALVGAAKLAGAAIEMACWDLVGKILGKRCGDLWGGIETERVEFAAYVFYRYDSVHEIGDGNKPENAADHAEELFETHGFRDIKFKNGVLTPEDEIRSVRLMRDRLGTRMRYLRIDPNAVWSVGTSIRVLNELADFGLEFCEDPTWGLEGMSLVRERTPVPLATNMACVTFEQIPLSVRVRALDIILGDIHFWGGPSAVLQLAKVCETFNLGLSLHSDRELGISTAAVLHVAAAETMVSHTIDTPPAGTGRRHHHRAVRLLRRHLAGADRPGPRGGDRPGQTSVLRRLPPAGRRDQRIQRPLAAGVPREVPEILMGDRVALVTGAAGELGGRIAGRLALDGFAVALACAPDDLSRGIAADRAAAITRDTGARTAVVAADIADERAVQRLADTVAEQLGPVSALVCNAATSVAAQREWRSLTAREWSDVLAINVTGTYLCVQACYDQLAGSGVGAVVVMSSVTPLLGRIGNLHYVTSKAALIGFTHALAREVGPDGVRVNAIAPGAIRSAGEAVYGSEAEVAAMMAPLQSLARRGEPDDVAAAVELPGGAGCGVRHRPIAGGRRRLGDALMAPTPSTPAIRTPDRQNRVCRQNRGGQHRAGDEHVLAHAL